MDEMEVGQAISEVAVSGVPTTFDESVVLLDAGAQHIPMGEVPARIGEIDPDAKLFVVCHLGGRSLRVARYLTRNGYAPINVNGGMQAWADAGRPVITDGGGAGTI